MVSGDEIAILDGENHHFPSSNLPFVASVGQIQVLSTLNCQIHMFLLKSPV